MQAVPKLLPETIRIFTELRRSGVMRGFELQRRAEIDDVRRFVDFARPLIENEFVTTSGPLDVETVERLQFSPLPYNAERAERAIRASISV